MTETTHGAVLGSESDRKIRDAIEDLLDEFAGVASTAIITDEIWNRIVGPALDASNGETERPRRCPSRVPEGNVVTEGRQCQQYEGHAHDHTWYGDNGHAYSAWSRLR